MKLTYNIILVLKTRQQAPKGVTYAKPHVTKLRLNLITVRLSRKWDMKAGTQEPPDQHWLGPLPDEALPSPKGK